LLVSDPLLTLIDDTANGGWSSKGMFSAENRPFPKPTDEFKRRN
jgi:hypothetical protein